MRRATGDGPDANPRAFVRRLGEAGYGPGEGRVGALDLLARSGLPVPEGFVLTTDGHREFLRARARGMAAGGGRVLGEALEREVRAALLELGARTVTVRWERAARRGLGTIPAVVAAVREAWTSAAALERWGPESADGTSPTWPVLVQRQARPEYTGWTTTAESLPDLGAQNSVPLHDVEPAAAGREDEGVARLTRRAAGVLGGAVQLGWGLEDGRWLLVSVEEETGHR